MPVKDTITIYRCRYCDMYYESENVCEQHEVRCSNNPNRVKHFCSMCKNRKVVNHEICKYGSRKVFGCQIKAKYDYLYNYCDKYVPLSADNAARLS